MRLRVILRHVNDVLYTAFLRTWVLLGKSKIVVLEFATRLTCRWISSSSRVLTLKVRTSIALSDSDTFRSLAYAGYEASVPTMIPSVYV